MQRAQCSPEIVLPAAIWAFQPEFGVCSTTHGLTMLQQCGVGAQHVWKSRLWSPQHLSSFHSAPACEGGPFPKFSYGNHAAQQERFAHAPAASQEHFCPLPPSLLNGKTLQTSTETSSALEMAPLCNGDQMGSALFQMRQ